MTTPMTLWPTDYLSVKVLRAVCDQPLKLYLSTDPASPVEPTRGYDPIRLADWQIDEAKLTASIPGGVVFTFRGETNAPIVATWIGCDGEPPLFRLVKLKKPYEVKRAGDRLRVPSVTFTIPLATGG